MPYTLPKLRGYNVSEGKIFGLYINQFGKSISESQDTLELIVGRGIVGDRHSDERLSDVREDVLKKTHVGKEVVIANTRQISIVSFDAMRVIAEQMEHPPVLSRINPSLLGANLCLKDIDVDALPPGTLLRFATVKGNSLEWRKATIAVWASNAPCVIPHENILASVRAHRNWVPSMTFVQAAQGRRGIVGFVYCSGKIKKDDICVAFVPDGVQS